MTRMGACIVPEKPAAPQESYEALRRDFGIDFWRVTPQAEVMFPEPGKFVPELTDGHVDAIRLAAGDAYLNLVHVPAHASGDVPAFVPGVGGSGAQVLAQNGLEYEAIAKVYGVLANGDPDFDGDRVKLVQTVTSNEHGFTLPEGQVLRFLRNYDTELTRTWAWNDPMPPEHKGTHTYGAKGYEAADRISANRPWCLDPKLIPHVDRQFMFDAGRQIAEHFGTRVEYHGFGNEFGNDMEDLLIRFDGANVEDGEDMVQTRIMPEMVQPYVAGVRSARSVRVIGGEHDGIDIGRRMLDAEKSLTMSSFGRYSFHPYPTSDFSQVAQYMKIAETHGYGRLAMIGEIAGAEMADWLAAVLRQWPQLLAICLLQQEWEGYYRDWWAGCKDLNDRNGTGLELTVKGLAVQRVLREANSKRKAARP